MPARLTIFLLPLPNTTTPQEDILSNQYTPPLILIILHLVLWFIILFVWCWCRRVLLILFFMWGRGCCFLHLLLRGKKKLGDRHPRTYTHPPTLQGLCADVHRVTLKCWWWVLVAVGPTSPRTNRRTQQTTSPPTHTHPPILYHPATIQGFCADDNRLSMEAILRLLLEHSKNRRTANAVP